MSNLRRPVLLSTCMLVVSLVATLGTVLHVHAQQGGDPCAVDLTTCTPLTLPSQQPPSDLWVKQCYQVQSNAQPYVYSHVNVVDGGVLVFVDDGGHY